MLLVLWKPQMELELHDGRFFKNSKTTFKCFKNFEIKNLDVDNVRIYNPEKSQFQIRCILG
jgi:hypothetical protein